MSKEKKCMMGGVVRTLVMIVSLVVVVMLAITYGPRSSITDGKKYKEVSEKSSEKSIKELEKTQSTSTK